MICRIRGDADSEPAATSGVPITAEAAVSITAIDARIPDRVHKLDLFIRMRIRYMPVPLQFMGFFPSGC
ncbi:hypothetical protein DSCO28_41380 [Desulfosarcina ovata subsp. sediminis]|uniref:Uncharacterized protein n=1 Tax=Desulfosarcina ovata subsp. sediminis TaxID=885957 RepID=A0A5K7ZTP5_9BACT|nr:hypothetical protein DSCO28_41380 [Desulfosarcina ovata subsp. sediminis]